MLNPGTPIDIRIVALPFLSDISHSSCPLDLNGQAARLICLGFSLLEGCADRALLTEQLFQAGQEEINEEHVHQRSAKPNSTFTAPISGWDVGKNVQFLWEPA